jgi:hypothetical protein
MFLGKRDKILQRPALLPRVPDLIGHDLGA